MLHHTVLTATPVFGSHSEAIPSPTVSQTLLIDEPLRRDTLPSDGASRQVRGPGSEEHSFLLETL